MLFVGCFMLYFDVVTYVETLDSLFLCISGKVFGLAGIFILGNFFNYGQVRVM